MNIFDATRKHYNAAGVHPTTDPDNPRSQFAVDRYENHLRKLIKLGMRALDLVVDSLSIYSIFIRGRTV